jgi:hypothetical protein
MPPINAQAEWYVLDKSENSKGDLVAALNYALRTSTRFVVSAVWHPRAEQIDFTARNGVPRRALLITLPENAKGVWPMKSSLALHSIAAQRGEGLRPELVSLLERWSCSESDGTSPAQPRRDNMDALPAIRSPSPADPCNDLRVRGRL